jgi:hypothetical protein
MNFEQRQAQHRQLQHQHGRDLAIAMTLAVAAIMMIAAPIGWVVYQALSHAH